MDFILAVAMFTSFVATFMLGIHIYRSSLPVDKHVENNHVDDDGNADTKEFDVQYQSAIDKETGKKALTAPLLATLASIVVAIIILNLWEVRGVPAEDLTLMLVLGIFVYTWSYLISLTPSSSRGWRIVFWIFVLYAVVVSFLGWWSHSSHVSVNNDTANTSTSVVTTTPSSTTPATSTDREPVGNMTTEGTTTQEMTIIEEIYR